MAQGETEGSVDSIEGSVASIEKLFDLFDESSGDKNFSPPIHQWHPSEILDIDLRITAEGQWRHQGRDIERRRLVNLFCSLLRIEEDGRHYLITPRLKYPVAVADAPFQAVEVRRRGAGREQHLYFRTNAGDAVLADRAHPICVITDAASGQPSPYIEVRDGLQAKFSRPVYYELAELLESADDANILGLYSAGEFFPFGRAD